MHTPFAETIDLKKGLGIISNTSPMYTVKSGYIAAFARWLSSK
jgi:hypothetical protein